MKKMYTLQLFFSSWLSAYQLGVESVSLESIQKITHCESPRIGLLTNQTGHDLQGRATVDIVRSRGMLVQRLFVPEHGLYGDIPAAEGVKTVYDKRTGLEVVGLLKNDGSLAPIPPVKLADIDLFMVDLQDVGMRHFTYSGFLFYLMEVAEKTGKPLIVLDRPNPLGGAIEGPVVKRVENSLIARAPLPLRHGLTMGELARFYNATCLANKTALTVIPLRNYTRVENIDDSLVARLSPNVSDKEATYAYSILGTLGEIRPFDVGLGTEYAMHLCALSLDVMPHEAFWMKLATKLKDLGLNTAVREYWSPRKNTWCRGLSLLFDAQPPQRSFEMLITIVDAARRAGVSLTFAPFFDRAIGDPLVKRFLEGKLSWQDLSGKINKQLAHYTERIKPLLLYQPLPRVFTLK